MRAILALIRGRFTPTKAELTLIRAIVPLMGGRII